MSTFQNDDDLTPEEQRKVWKKNSEFLYDFGLDYQLTWPSLTSQWLPGQWDLSENATSQSLLIGTQTDENEDPDSPNRNYLMVAEVALPKPGDKALDFDDHFDRAKHGFGRSLAKPKPAFEFNPKPPAPKEKTFTIVKKILHKLEINRARYMPQSPNIVATKSPNPEVFIFDLEKHLTIAEEQAANNAAAASAASSSSSAVISPVVKTFNPQLTLKGHTTEGFGVSWSPFTKGHLLSVANDGSLCHWDINSAETSSITELDALNKVTIAHMDGAGDVDWNSVNAHTFATVGDDHSLALWDLRQAWTTGTNGTPTHRVTEAHTNSAVNSVSYNPFDEFSLATGGSDGIVKLWDCRKLSSSIHSLQGHDEDSGVYQLSWSKLRKNLLASSAEDAKLIIWDLNRIGQEQSEEDAEDGPPELLHIHCGHTAKVFDFAWHPTLQWTMASVASDNALQVWQMSEALTTEEDGDEDIDDDDLEGDDDDEDDDGEEEQDEEEDAGEDNKQASKKPRTL